MPKSQVIRDWQARLDAATAPLPRRTSMWLEDPNSPSGWTWRPPEPRAEATHLLPAYRRHELREDRMTQPDDGLVSYDPNDPHDPALADLDQPGFGEGQRLEDPVLPEIAVCPTCGTAVARDRLRS